MLSIRHFYSYLQNRYQNDEKFWRQCQILFFVLRYVTLGGVVLISAFLYFTSCAYTPSAIRPLLLPCWFVNYEQNDVTFRKHLDFVVHERSIDLRHLRNKAWESSPAYSIPIPLRDMNESFITDRLVNQEWVLEVATTVQLFPSKIATVVVLSNDLIEMFLNWLIFIQNSRNKFGGNSILLNNLLVLSLDAEVSKFLKRYEIGYVEMSPELVPLLNSSELAESPIAHQIQTCQFLVAWFLNYLGYSALLVELDAIVLQDIDFITTAYPEYDVIAGRDALPMELAEKWGDTVSSGFMLIKSSSHVEMLWRTLHLMDTYSFEQHSNLNYALERMGVSWHESINSQSSFGRGVTLREKLSILLLPETIVCRRCDTRDKAILQTIKVVHVTEAIGLKERIKSMQEFGRWKLRIDWRECIGNTKGLAVSRLVDVLPYLSVDNHRGPCNIYD